MNVDGLKTKWPMVPGQRTVTHLPQNPTAATQSIIGCTRRPWSRNEISLYASSSGATDDKAAFKLPCANYVAPTPKGGDKLTDDEGVVWTILGTVLELEGSFLRCTCIGAKT